MATEHTCTELVPRAYLENGAGRFIAHAAARHVAFVVVEEMLQDTGPGVQIALTVDRVIAADGVTFTAHAELADAGA